MNSEDNVTNLECSPSTSDHNDATSLEACSPVTGHQPATAPSAGSRIKRPRRDEPFTTVAGPVPIACIVDRKLDKWGNPTGEEYYPVTGELQNQVGAGLRTVAFHPCMPISGVGFIYPQKQDPPHAWANSWNASLAQALELPPGQWRTVWSDKDEDCYQHDQVAPPVEGIPGYPGFQEDLEQALTPNIIDSLDHPVLQRLLGQQDTDNDIEEVY